MRASPVLPVPEIRLPTRVLSVLLCRGRGQQTLCVLTQTVFDGNCGDVQPMLSKPVEAVDAMAVERQSGRVICQRLRDRHLFDAHLEPQHLADDLVVATLFDDVRARGAVNLLESPGFAERAEGNGSQVADEDLLLV